MTRSLPRVGGALAALLALAAVSCSNTPPSDGVIPTPRPAEQASRPAGAPTGSAGNEVALPEMQVYRVPAGSRPHDVAPAADGAGVWYTAQGTGKLGYLDPRSGEVREIPLGTGSAPHGVIVGQDGAAWVTDGGLNAIVRVDPETEAVSVYRLPASAPGANLNTAAFDRKGILWFTAQAGWYGRLDPESGEIQVFPRRAAAALTASRRRRPATSTTRRWPEITLPGSTSRRARRR